MSSPPFVIRSQRLAEGRPGELLNFSRETAQWEWMSLAVRRLAPGDGYDATTQHGEEAYVHAGDFTGPRLATGHAEPTVAVEGMMSALGPR